MLSGEIEEVPRAGEVEEVDRLQESRSIGVAARLVQGS
jgi:hypothetical protein